MIHAKRESGIWVYPYLYTLCKRSIPKLLMFIAYTNYACKICIYSGDVICTCKLVMAKECETYLHQINIDNTCVKHECGTTVSNDMKIRY